MFKSSTLVSGLYGAGLVFGFLRDMIMVRTLGSSAATDAFIVAIFLSDTLRMTVAGGVIAAAFVPLWAATSGDARRTLAASTTLGLLGVALMLALALRAAAPFVIALLGPGLSPTASAAAVAAFDTLVWTVPAIALHGLLGAIHNANDRFLLPSAASVLYNGWIIGYLLAAGSESSVEGLSLASLLASMVMAASLVPGAWRFGWRPFCRSLQWQDFRRLAVRLAPLLAGSLAGHAAVLVERSLASLLGEGAVTLVNLARKITTVPIAGINSLSQVALPRFVTALHQGGSADLRRQIWLSLALGTVLTWPASTALIICAPALGHVLLPLAGDQQYRAFAGLITGFALAVVPAGWSILLTRSYYAKDDMVTPTRLEIAGMIVHLLSLALLYRLLGLSSVPTAVLLGVLVTAALLVRGSALCAEYATAAKSMAALLAATGLVFLAAAGARAESAIWTRLALATAFFVVSTAAGAAALRRWQIKQSRRINPLAPEVAEPL